MPPPPHTKPENVLKVSRVMFSGFNILLDFEYRQMINS